MFINNPITFSWNWFKSAQLGNEYFVYLVITNGVACLDLGIQVSFNLPTHCRLGPHTVITFIILEQMNMAYKSKVLGVTGGSGGL